MIRYAQKLIPLLISLLLSGCAGTFLLCGEGGYIDAPFPDIRTVPSREEATCPRRPLEKKTEDALENLERERNRIKGRDKALREKIFPESCKGTGD